MNFVKIERQGRVIVNSCDLVHDTRQAKILCLDLKTKYADIVGYDVNGIVLEATDRSIHVSEETGFTIVSFPKFEGYEVIASSCGRYTCYVTLLNKKRDHDDRPWIGVDFDGTIVEDTGWKGSRHIGKPIPKMMNRVRDWLREGKRVKIFKARANPMIDTEGERYIDRMFYLRKWLFDNFGQEIEITYEKDLYMIELWDDRCVQVVLNTGERVDGRDG